MGEINGICQYAKPKGKALYCYHKNHYNDVCFFTKWCGLKNRPMNTDSYVRCPIREGAKI